MKPIHFPQANRELSKPDSMTDEECGPLPVLTDGRMCVSLWKASLRERLSILFFGRVWLWIYSGYTQPPVALGGEKNIFD
jgi:hypothetical protein